MERLKRFWNYKFFDKKAKEIRKEQEQLRQLPKNTEVNIIEDTANPHIIIIEPYETFKIHDLANMFPFNVTPALIESKIQHVIAAKQGMINKMTPQFVMMFLMILIGASVAGVILWKFFGGGVPEVMVTLGPGLQAANTLINYTG